MRGTTNNLIFPLLLLGVFIVFASSCKKDDDNNGGNNTGIPILTTTVVTDISQTTATCGGNISSDGGATVTSRGVCWSTGQTPTISDNKTEDGTGSGSFTSSVTDLEPNTTYYLRAYAINSVGTAYGSALSFTTEKGISGSTFTDPRDGKVYKTVVIGAQEWMAENLAYAPTSGNYWAYSNMNRLLETYGYLYDWQTAKNVCPAGWHLPSDEEWTELTDYLGESVAGGKLKETGTKHWALFNYGATNETGFTALPGGIRLPGDSFVSLTIGGFWWSATEDDIDEAWCRAIYNNDRYVSIARPLKVYGLSVRCLKD